MNASVPIAKLGNVHLIGFNDFGNSLPEAEENFAGVFQTFRLCKTKGDSVHSRLKQFTTV